METPEINTSKLSHTKRLSHDDQARIRSFVVRAGRMSERKLTALDEGMKRFGVAYQKDWLNYHGTFARSADTVVEIGFGMGASLAWQALREPDKNFLGIEVHPPGVANLCALLSEQNISNVRVIQHDAVEVLRDMIAPQSLNRIQVYFPDPWPKLRHHKRRILQADFLQVLVDKLTVGGLFHMATDWVPYAEAVLSLCQVQGSLYHPNNDFSPRPDFRPETKFERRGIGFGHDIRDILFTKK